MKKITDNMLSSERHLKNILDHMPAMIGNWGRDLRNRFGNHAYYDWFGIDPKDLPGMHIKDVIGEKLFQLNLPYIEAVLRGERKTFEREIPSTGGDGEQPRYSLAEYIPEWVDGEVVGFYALISNVTQLKRLEKLRHEDEVRYRAMIEDQTDVICRFLADGTILFVNEVFCRFFGKSQAELVGNKWFPVAHSDNVQIISERVNCITVENPVAIIQNRVVAADGHEHWMEFVNRGFFGADGSLREIQSVGRNITHRKNQEEALRVSDERLQLALSASDLATWDFDISSGQISFSDRWYLILGYAVGEIEFNLAKYDEMVHPEDLAIVRQLVESHLMGESPNYKSEHRLRHKDGHWIWIQSRGKVVSRDGEGNPLRMVGTHCDISDVKRLRTEGTELLKRIEALIVGFDDGKKSVGLTNIASEEPERLTSRQHRVLELIAKGNTSAQIAVVLNISTSTVISHRKNLMKRLGVNSTAGLIRYAVEQELIN